MTILEAINTVDDLKHNAYERGHKIGWLSRLDTMIKKQIIDTHEGGNDVPFTGYGYDTDISTELLVPAPYDEIYLRWMEAQIDFHNGEYDSYNSAIILFNTVYDAYQAFYTRNHMPLSGGNRFIF